MRYKCVCIMYRYGEERLPGVDIFVCTADPMLEGLCVAMTARMHPRTQEHTSPWVRRHLNPGSTCPVIVRSVPHPVRQHWSVYRVCSMRVRVLGMGVRVLGMRAVASAHDSEFPSGCIMFPYAYRVRPGVCKASGRICS